MRLDPRNKEIDLDGLMYGKIPDLTGEDMKKQEGDYIYRYRYNGGGATQVWLSSGRYVIVLYFLLNFSFFSQKVSLGKIGLMVYSVSQEILLAHTSYIHEPDCFCLFIQICGD